MTVRFISSQPRTSLAQMQHGLCCREEMLGTEHKQSVLQIGQPGMPMVAFWDRGVKVLTVVTLVPDRYQGTLS